MKDNEFNFLSCCHVRYTGSAGVLVGHPLDTIKVCRNDHSTVFIHEVPIKHLFLRPRYGCKVL